MGNRANFYIDHHPGQISLDGEWRFEWLDEAAEEIGALTPVGNIQAYVNAALRYGKY